MGGLRGSPLGEATGPELAGRKGRKGIFLILSHMGADEGRKKIQRKGEGKVSMPHDKQRKGKGKLVHG